MESKNPFLLLQVYNSGSQFPTGLTQKEEPCLDALAAVGSELVKAFKDIGFVYVTGHGVPEDVVS